MGSPLLFNMHFSYCFLEQMDFVFLKFEKSVNRFLKSAR